MVCSSMFVTWLDFGRMIRFFRASDRSAFRICPPTLVMLSLSRNGSSLWRELVFLDTVFFFFCPVHNYRTWRSLGCFGDFISEGNTFLCNSFIISTLASFKLTALGPVLAEVSLVGWCSDVPSLSSFPLDMTSLYRLCLKQSTTAIFAISSNT